MSCMDGGGGMSLERVSGDLRIKQGLLAADLTD